MEKNRAKINLVQPIIFLAAVLLIGAALSFIFSGANDKRAQEIHDKYAAEFAAYQQRNQIGLEELFTQAMPQRACNSSGNGAGCARSVERRIISNLIDSSLVDPTSTAFVKMGSDGNVMIMSWTGEISKMYRKDGDVARLLNGEVASLPWDEYHHTFRQKEVVLPVTNSQGQIIGAVIRGVVE